MRRGPTCDVPFVRMEHTYSLVRGPDRPLTLYSLDRRQRKPLAVEKGVATSAPYNHTAPRARRLRTRWRSPCCCRSRRRMAPSSRSALYVSIVAEEQEALEQVEHGARAAAAAVARVSASSASRAAFAAVENRPRPSSSPSPSSRRRIGVVDVGGDEQRVEELAGREVADLAPGLGLAPPAVARWKASCAVAARAARRPSTLARAVGVGVGVAALGSAPRAPSVAWRSDEHRARSRRQRRYRARRLPSRSSRRRRARRC